MEYSNHAGHSSKIRGESALPTTHSEMSDSSEKRRNIYIDNPKDISKLTFLVHGPRHSSYECKVLGDFGSKYSKIGPNKYHGHETNN